MFTVYIQDQIDVLLKILFLRDICFKDATASLLFKNTKLEFELTENLQGYAIQVKEGRRGMTNQLLIFCSFVIYWGIQNKL